MTTVIETTNGWAVLRERDRHVLADGFRIGGVGLIVKTANRSRAPNTWRGELDWRRARLHGRPTRSVKDETFPTETPRGGWPSTTSRQRRVRRADGQGRMWRKCDRTSRPRQGSSMTGERTQGKAPSRPNRSTEPASTTLSP